MIKSLRTITLIAFEAGALVVEVALIAVAVQNIVETLQQAPKEEKPEERRWVN
jgi:hypothetical protein